MKSTKSNEKQSRMMPSSSAKIAHINEKNYKILFISEPKVFETKFKQINKEKKIIMLFLQSMNHHSIWMQQNVNQPQ